ncbi:MAG: cyclic nucleotide-binding domain-containing protein [Deltaproteobacteria bacterium]|nr:cyclic nucleotide-binding domain-containing protein [Deltaproteobacteria bacterium]
MFSSFRRNKRDDKVAAEEHYSKGRWTQALEAYERLLAREPENVKILRRVADLRVKAGRRAEAVHAYRKVADLFAATGFLVQAIAIQKILLRLDPGARDVGRKLAELYAKRGFASQPAACDEKRELPRIPLFSDLDAESFRQVLERVLPRALEAGDVVFRQGEPGDSIFIVASGTVRVARGELPLAELGEGEFFGEAAFFSREPRNADVSATGPTELLELRRVDAEALAAKYPGVRDGLGAFYRRRVLDGLLASSSLFGDLPEAERRRIADLFRGVPIAKGESVVREGEAERALFLVLRGRFQVTTAHPNGSGEVALSELGPGEFFGEVAFVSGRGRSATVSAAEEGEVLRIEGDDLDSFVERHPELGSTLSSLRDDRARDTISKVLGRKP